ncbi:Hypothetical protein HDN1F_10460 [gamma proteobacterium HdN1]|nr:Hypothetical protein HDN1F_10460 [gamma proteobacterium HdN1]
MNNFACFLGVAFVPYASCCKDARGGRVVFRQNFFRVMVLLIALSNGVLVADGFAAERTRHRSPNITPGAVVNINRADAATISRYLKGVGPVKAQAIVDYRERYGPFRSIDELTEVKGIGDKTLQRVRGLIRVE